MFLRGQRHLGFSLFIRDWLGATGGQREETYSAGDET